MSGMEYIRLRMLESLASWFLIFLGAGRGGRCEIYRARILTRNGWWILRD